MKVVIGIIVIIGAIFGTYKIWERWQEFKDTESATQRAAPPIAPTQLRGLPDSLETTLAEAERKGASGLRDFLTRYGKTIQDPRLAWIELDYVVLVGRTDVAEARRVFAKVKKRTEHSSPVYKRVQQLEKTFG